MKYLGNIKWVYENKMIWEYQQVMGNRKGNIYGKHGKYHGRYAGKYHG